MKINIKDKNRITIIAIAVLIFCITVFVATAEIIMLDSNQHIVDHIDGLDSKEFPVAVIFGGGMDAQGVQSQDQKDRVTLGIDLYKQNKVQSLLMTGDDGGLRNNEVDYMRAQAVYGGVPLYSVEVDGKGYRTFESCRRLKEEYNYQNILVVSQQYHLKRIIYICNNLGLNTTGIAADTYLNKKVKSHFREPFARVKALGEVFLYNL